MRVQKRGHGLPNSLPLALHPASRHRPPMDDLLRQLTQWAAGLSPLPLLLLAFGAGVIETIFPPFPSDTLLVALSFTAARGPTSPLFLILSATMGSFLSLYLLYVVGRGRLKGRARRWIDRLRLGTDRHLDDWFSRRGYRTILVSRFLPGVRAPITFLAGAYGLKPAPMALALATSCLLWNSLVVMIGFGVGRRWNGTVSGLCLGALGLAAAMAVVWLIGVLGMRWMRGRR